MADFVKNLFGGQKPVQAPVVGDDGVYSTIPRYGLRRACHRIANTPQTLPTTQALLIPHQRLYPPTLMPPT
jgi:hypothetical protein